MTGKEWFERRDAEAATLVNAAKAGRLGYNAKAVTFGFKGGYDHADHHLTAPERAAILNALHSTFTSVADRAALRALLDRKL